MPGFCLSFESHATESRLCILCFYGERFDLLHLDSERYDVLHAAIRDRGNQQGCSWPCLPARNGKTQLLLAAAQPAIPFTSMEAEGYQGFICRCGLIVMVQSCTNILSGRPAFQHLYRNLMVHSLIPRHEHFAFRDTEVLPSSIEGLNMSCTKPH